MHNFHFMHWEDIRNIELYFKTIIIRAKGPQKSVDVLLLLVIINPKGKE